MVVLKDVLGSKNAAFPFAMAFVMICLKSDISFIAYPFCRTDVRAWFMVNVPT